MSGYCARVTNETAPTPRGVARRTKKERDAERALVAGGAVLLAGLFSVGTGVADAGKLLVVAGVIILAAGIHFFGRLGPDI